MVDTRDQGRNALKLTHNGEFAMLVNRIGMDERQSVGNTKGSFDVYLDDDAPAVDDIHDEPALGSVALLGLHQPDGRGEFFGDGITSDPRDDMLFKLAGLDAAGAWELNHIDARFIGTTTTFLRRWALTLKSACGEERFVGTAKDLPPGTGIFDISLDPGAVNLTVLASFTPGDPVVDYRVDLVDNTMPGSGTLEITDGAGNVTPVAINLAAASGDVNLPTIGGATNQATFEFEGTATDVQAGDTGVSSIGLAPYADNLQIVSVSPLGGVVDFVIGLVNPAENGRGYVRAVDGCGQRAYVLVEIDALDPICTGTIDQSKRFFSGPQFIPLPDNNLAGVNSSILVTDSGTIADVDITFNITHGFDDDIDMTMTSPGFIALFNDLGSTGNDFIDTTLDDEAAGPMPDLSSAAPFTGSFQPSGLLSLIDGLPVTNTYTLNIVDDKTNDFGTFDHWSVRIKSPQFVEQYDGRAEDSATFDSGICTIELLPGAANLALTIDPSFVAGDAIARYTVSLVDRRMDGSGTVRVSDCAGNTCEVPLTLGGICHFVDLGVVNLDDYFCFEPCLDGPNAGLGATCAVFDFDTDGDVDLADFRAFQAMFTTP
jgi:subtilisin-like proprotein convertase family protein